MNSRTNSSAASELLLPVTARRNYNRANEAMSQNAYITAVESFDRAFETYHELVEREGRAEFALNTADCLMGRAAAHRALGEFAKAVRDYSDANNIYDILDGFGDEHAAERRATCHTCLGSIRESLHEYAFAVDEFDRAITIYLRLQQEQSNPDQFDAMLVDCMIRRGNAYRGQLALSESLRDYGDAIELCDMIPENEPERVRLLLLGRACLNRSVARAMQGECTLAFVDLENARRCALRHALITLDRLKGFSWEIITTAGTWPARSRSPTANGR